MSYPYDEPGLYAIHVIGEVDAGWSDRLGGMTLKDSETANEGTMKVSVLIGLLEDQAALFGVLETLYQNRFPVVLVRYIGPRPELAPARGA